MKEADSEKEATMEAELRAARERAIVPLEARMTQFKEMLLERGVSTKDVTSLVVQSGILNKSGGIRPAEKLKLLRQCFEIHI